MLRRVWPFTPRGTGAVLIGLACVFASARIGVPLLTVIGVAFVALPLLSLLVLWLARPVRSVTRSIGADVLPVGREANVTLAAELGQRLGSACVWRDEHTSAVVGSAVGVFTWGTGERQHARYAVRAAIRGRHPLGPLVVSLSDPLGLARRSKAYGDQTTVTIAPEVVELPALTVALGEAGGSLHSKASHLGEGSDNLIVRPYLPGDSMRRINWRATAHRDELMVRQEERESTPAATVVFDRSPHQWASTAVVPGSDPRFEAGLSAAVSIAIRLLLEGYTVSVVDADGVEYCDPLVGTEDVTAMLAAFAVVRVAAHDGNGAVGTGEGSEPLGPVALVTGRTPQAWTAALAARASLPVMLAVEADHDALSAARRDGWRAARLATGGGDAAVIAWLDAIEGGARGNR